MQKYKKVQIKYKKVQIGWLWISRCPLQVLALRSPKVVASLSESSARSRFLGGGGDPGAGSDEDFEGFGTSLKRSGLARSIKHTIFLISLNSPVFLRCGHPRSVPRNFLTKT